MLHSFYQKYLLPYPLAILSLLLIGILSFGVYASKLEIDASAETLLLDDDKDLAFARTVGKRFSGDDVLVLVYQPKESMLTKKSIQTLTQLTSDLKSLTAIKSVDSILSVPLLFSPIQGLEELLDNTIFYSLSQKMSHCSVKFTLPNSFSL